MLEKIWKACTVKEIDGKPEGIISFTLTKRIVDRDSEVIEPKGAKTQNFKNNPVVLWAHQSGGWFREAIPPIGKVLMNTLSITEDEVAADIAFDLEDPFAKMIYLKLKNKFLSAGSIGFMPLAWDKEPVLPNQKGYTITKWELFEFSIVPVPANPAALARSFSKEELEDDRAKEWYETLKDFMEDENFDHTPEGWVAKINKLEESKKEGTDPKIKEEPEPEPIRSFEKTDEIERPTETIKDWIEDILIQMHNTGAVPFRPFPKSEEADQFNYTRALERVREWASSDGSGDEDKINFSKFRRAFAWFDPANPKSINSYKMLHHDVDSATGELKTIWRGVAESMILFLGGKGRIDVPDNEKGSVYNHLVRHYTEFNKSIPDLKVYTQKELNDLGDDEVNLDQEEMKKLTEEVILQLHQLGVVV